MLNQINCKDIIALLPVGVYLTDKNRKITYWNRAAEEISGYRADDVMGLHCHDNLLVHVDDKGNSLCRGLCPLARTMADGQGCEADVFLSHKQGHRVAVHVHTLPLRDENGEIIGGAEIFNDISDLLSMRRKTEMLEKMAFFDSLTRLPNREHIESELAARFHEFHRYGIPFGVLFLDIDHFKDLNDMLGHDVGDRVLKMVAATLLGSARSFDIFGRWGGEEFLGIVRNVDAGNLSAISERYLRLIEKSHVTVNGKQISVTVSIGASLVRHDDTSDTIIKRTDYLMYQSKQKGRNRLTIDD
jgi:diguanylate cyclase (GGDEF)-like protein/PAS domain S-box-containing protein